MRKDTTILSNLRGFFAKREDNHAISSIMSVMEGMRHPYRLPANCQQIWNKNTAHRISLKRKGRAVRVQKKRPYPHG